MSYLKQIDMDGKTYPSNKIAKIGGVDSLITKSSFSGFSKDGETVDKKDKKPVEKLVAGIYNAAGKMVASLTKELVEADHISAKVTTPIPSILGIDSKDVVKVILPNDITAIGSGSFSWCDNLIEVNFPKSNTLKTIGEYSFEYCNNLKSINIPEGVSTIGKGAFIKESNVDLESLTIPSTVTSIIGDYVFSGSAISKSKFINNSTLDPETYSYWGATIYDYKTDDGLYINDTKLVLFNGYVTADLIIPDGVTEIADSVFSNKIVASIDIPSSVTIIGNGAFNSCETLVTVIGADGLVTIGASAFGGCIGLVDMTISDNVTEIQDDAFMNCTLLNDLVIPDTVSYIGNEAFLNVPHIYYNGEAEGSPWGALAVN